MILRRLKKEMVVTQVSVPNLTLPLYSVCLCPELRLRIDRVAAASQVEALEKAETLFSRLIARELEEGIAQLSVRLESIGCEELRYVELSEDCHNALVDEEGDENYTRSNWYTSEGRPGWELRYQIPQVRWYCVHWQMPCAMSISEPQTEERLLAVWYIKSLRLSDRQVYDYWALVAASSTRQINEILDQAWPGYELSKKHDGVFQVEDGWKPEGSIQLQPWCLERMRIAQGLDEPCDACHSSPACGGRVALGDGTRVCLLCAEQLHEEKIVRLPRGATLRMHADVSGSYIRLCSSDGSTIDTWKVQDPQELELGLAGLVDAILKQAQAKV